MYILMMLTLLMLVTSSAHAANISPSQEGRNDIPSCRQLLMKEAPVTERNYVIAIDRTTLFDQTLIKDFVKRAVLAIRGGDHLQIVSVSGSNQPLTFVEFDAYIDLPPTDAELETKVSATQIKKTQACFKKQIVLARKKTTELLTVLLSDFRTVSYDEPSEIAKAIKTIASQNLNTKAKQKLFLLFSDMIEWSDHVRIFSYSWVSMLGNKNLLVVHKNGSLDLCNLQRARVVVAGVSGSIHLSGKAWRSPTQREMGARKSYWENYFKLSNGQLEIWGEPALLTDI